MDSSIIFFRKQLMFLIFFDLLAFYLWELYLVEIPQNFEIEHLQYLTYIFETKSIPKTNSGNSGTTQFSEINHASHPNPMLQHIEKVATSKLARKDCLRYFQTTLTMGEGG